MAEPMIDQTSESLFPGPHESRPPPARVRRPPAARVALIQGGYLLAIGLWPIVGFKSFTKVTGPRLEGWPTKGVGACTANIGAAIGAAGARGKVARELRILGITTALTFAAMDFWYAGFRRRISKVYLLNGLAQLGFAGLWGVAEWLETREARRLPEAAFA
jgi:hypothetical protein